MIPQTYKDYYGDETRWFVGVVKSINDPLELGRLKVRIYGVHPEHTLDVSDDDLPWAQVVVPITEGGSSGIGTNVGIKPQAQVYGIFLDGKNSQLPLILGSIPKYESGIIKDSLYRLGTVADEVQHDDLVNSPSGTKNRVAAEEVDKKYLVGNTNIEKAFNFFLTQEGGGFTPAQACGIVGNFYIESAAAMNNNDLNTVATSAPPEKSYGIAQWNSSKNAGYRYQNLVEFTANRNLQWYSLYGQLLFTIRELYDHKTYYRLNDLKRAKSPEEACRIFEDRFENPKVKGQQERIDVSNELYRKLV